MFRNKSRKQQPPASEPFGVFGSSTGTLSSEGHGTHNYAPMQNNTGRVLTRTPNRNVPPDHDPLPRTLRRFVAASGVQDVQLNNGLFRGIGSGKRIPYRGAGYLYAVAPIIPGQTRGDWGGYHVRGPSPLNVDRLWEAGPGSQPDNPGGPGKIAATHFVNPMSG